MQGGVGRFLSIRMITLLEQTVMWTTEPLFYLLCNSPSASESLEAKAAAPSQPFSIPYNVFSAFPSIQQYGENGFLSIKKDIPGLPHSLFWGFHLQGASAVLSIHGLSVALTFI